MQPAAADLKAAVGEAAEGEDIGGRDGVHGRRQRRPQHHHRRAQEPLRAGRRRVGLYSWRLAAILRHCLAEV